MYIEKSSTKDAGLVEIAGEAELVHEYAQAVEDENGTLYRASVWGRQEPNGQWIGWIEFHALGLNSPVVSTGRETTQSTRTALEYWASGLGAVYLDGALSRALTPATEPRSML
jgi:hypothetical protein